MSSSILRLTQFQVQRLQCIGGGSRTAPYRITTYHGVELGSLGEVMQPLTAASNAPVIEHSGLQGLKRLLTRFSY